MRCERCWSREDVEGRPRPQGGHVPLCGPCWQAAPEHPVLFERLFLPFASRKEFHLHFDAEDDRTALRRWAKTAGLTQREARDVVAREAVSLDLLGDPAALRPRQATAPYGYRRRDGGLVPHGYEAEVVRRIFRGCREGHSLAAIAQTLNREGIPTRRGREWHRSTVRYVLRNPLYTGFVRRTGFVRAGAHPPLVSSRDFREVQRILARRCRRPSQKRAEARLG